MSTRSLLLAGLVVLTTSCGSATMPPSLRHALFEKTAPSLGESTPARGLSQGPRATVVDFWASWCPTCTRTLPLLDTLYREHEGDGVLVVGVAVDEDPRKAEAFHGRFASFPLILDPEQRLAARFGVAQVPLTFVLDGDDVVRWVGRDPADVERAVRAILASSSGDSL